VTTGPRTTGPNKDESGKKQKTGQKFEAHEFAGGQDNETKVIREFGELTRTI